MTGIDQLAYHSPLKNIHPGEKLLMAISTLLMVISLNSVILSGLVLLFMTYLLLVKGRIRGRFYLAIMGIPLGFLLLAGLTIVISLGAEPAAYICYLDLGAVRLGVTPLSLSQAGMVMGKSLAAISCLYFLALTTPMTQLIYVFRKMKLPPVFIDLMTVIYSYIFLLFQAASEIYVAQLSRGGYRGFRGTMKSLALLCSNLLLKSLKASEDAYNCLASRGFDGHFEVIEETYHLKKINLLAIALWNILLLLLVYTGRYLTCLQIF